MRTLTVIVDMQNDFITGALPAAGGEEIVGKIANYIKEHPTDDYIYTLDTHYENYFETQEGKKLPVKHCIRGTEGWQMVKDIRNVLPRNATGYEKSHFGSVALAQYVAAKGFDRVNLVGVCTDICVISNAMLIKAYARDNTEIYVLSDMCAGVTAESHENALAAMKMCQINVE